MAPQIILPKEFDIKNLAYSDVKHLDNGGKIVYISYNRVPLLLQTPTMSAPFGLNSWDGGDVGGGSRGAVKYSLDLSFKDMDTTPSLKFFFNVLSSLDKKLVLDGYNQQSAWFKGKRYSAPEIVEALYTPLIKYAKDKYTGEKTDAFPPTFKATVPPTCDVFGSKRETVALKDVETKGSRITAIIQCTGVWFTGGKFGVSWKIVQMKVVPSQSKLTGFALRDDDEVNLTNENENDEVDEGLIAAAAEASAAECVVSSSDDSSEEDGDEF